jgi:hypothetical protein
LSTFTTCSSSSSRGSSGKQQQNNSQSTGKWSCRQHSASLLNGKPAGPSRRSRSRSRSRSKHVPCPRPCPAPPPGPPLAVRYLRCMHTLCSHGAHCQLR